MKASVGDEIRVLSSSELGVARHGVVVEVTRRDGTPPYVVEWDDGRKVLLYPGSDTHITHKRPRLPSPSRDVPAQPDAQVETVELPHVKRWRVTVDIFESGDVTDAHAVLFSETPHHIDAHGAARRNPDDVEVPEIGDEVAVARALRRLADELLQTASDDIAELEGHEVSLRV
jgi:hypothetical protein